MSKSSETLLIFSDNFLSQYIRKKLVPFERSIECKGLFFFILVMCVYNVGLYFYCMKNKYHCSYAHCNIRKTLVLKYTRYFYYKKKNWILNV